MRHFITSQGEIISRISGSIDQVELNTPSNAIYVDVDYEVANAYWDFDLHEFVSISEAPSAYHQFSYSAKEWFDPRTLADLKSQKWEIIKQARDALEFGGFEFEGHTYDSDQTSQGRIMGAAMSQMDQVWTTADNSTVSLTTNQLASLYVALQVHVANAHAMGRVARAALDAATSVQEINAIVL